MKVRVKNLNTLLPECFGELTFSHCNSSVNTCRCPGAINISNSVMIVAVLSNVPGMMLTTLCALSNLVLPILGSAYPFCRWRTRNLGKLTKVT